MGTVHHDQEISDILQYVNAQYSKDFSIFIPSENSSDILTAYVLTLCEDLLKKMSESRGIEDIEIRVAGIDDVEVNAFCLKYQDTYFIGIHSGTGNYLQDIIENFIQLDKQFVDLPDDERKSIFIKIFVYAFHYILKHEYMHIIYGHCDLIQNNFRCYMQEYAEARENISEGLSTQAMEYIADLFAVKDEIQQILYFCNYKIENIQKELKMFYYGIMAVLSLFYEESWGPDWENEQDIEKAYSMSHPVAECRFYYMADAVDDTMLRAFRDGEWDENIVEEIDSVIDEIMETVKNNQYIFQPGLMMKMLSENAQKYFVNLYNASNKFAREAEIYSHYKIETQQTVEIKDYIRQVFGENIDV